MNASKILPGLFQGGQPESARAVTEAGFEWLILCAREVQPPSAALGTLQRVRCPLDDTLEPISDTDWRMVWQTAHHVAHRVEEHEACLVTCAQGRNRSGLVTGVALHLLTGWDGERVVQHIQKRRDNALTNSRFADTLRQLRA